MNFNPILLDAAANAAPQNKNSLFLMLGVYALIFGAMYLILIRPQKKKQKEVNFKMLTLLFYISIS